MTKNITWGNDVIGTNGKVFIIAEAADSHLGDMSIAHEMIRQSKLAGANAIKFQHHLPDEEMLPDTPMSDNFEEPLYDFLKRNALSIEQHAKLKAYCESIGIYYLCTPFSWKAAQELEEIGVIGYKIGSGEMTDIPTLTNIAAYGKPMIVSTGMSTFAEIDRTYTALSQIGVPLALTYCISEYPPVYDDMNLLVIPQMIDRYPEAVIGHSDHTPDLYTCFAAVTLGAKIIEKHITLDKRRPGPDQSVSIDMRDLANLVDGIRKIEASLGSEKTIHGREQQIREWAFRSIVTTRAIKAGEVIDKDAIWSKRPGTGIPAHERDNVVGKRATRDIPSNVMLKWEDFQ